VNILIRTFNGNDLIITRQELRALGLKPGDRVVIQPAASLAPSAFSAEEIERRAATLGPTGSQLNDHTEPSRKSEHDDA